MNNLPTIYTITYNEQEAKVRLDKFLAQNIPDHSRTKIQKLISLGALKLNGVITTTADIKVAAGDVLTLEIPFEYNYELPLQASNLSLDIVFEDHDIIIINKPSGLTVHPGAGNHNDTLVNALLGSHAGKLSTVADLTRPGIVHRLDKDTSGLLVIAKNNTSHHVLSKMLAERTISRTYQALVYGTPHPKVGTIVTQYGRSKRDPKKMCVFRSNGKQATTHYKVLSELCGGVLSLIECKLETGRTHQIRVHMEYWKNPIVGDQSYGRSLNYNLSNLSEAQSKAVRTFPHQALHARHLSFAHPKTGKLMEFTANLPNDFQALINLLTD